MSARRAMFDVTTVGALVALVAAAGAVRPAAQGDRWVEIISPNFTVVSDAGEGAARQAAWQFEQIRAAIRAGWPWAQGELDRPFLIIGVRNEASMRAFAPQYWDAGVPSGVRPGSVSVTGTDRHYLLLRTDLRADGPEGTNPYQLAYWGYTAAVLGDAFGGRLPLWFTRGLASVLSNTNVTNDEVQFGRPVRSYIGEVMSGRLPLADVLTMTRESPAFSQEIARDRFDAQSWALMHFLIFGETGGESNADRLNDISRLVQSGSGSVAAVEQVFGSVEALDEAYRRYLERGSFRYSVMPVDAAFDRARFGVRPVGEAESLGYRASFLVTMGREVEARQAIDAALAREPAQPVPHVALGRLEDQLGRLEPARAAFGRAVELGSQEFYPYYRLAALAPRDGATPEALQSLVGLLTKAVALNRSHAPGYALLGSVQLQAGEAAQAVVSLRRAATLAPTVASTRLTLARALLAGGQREAALREAQAALALAATDPQREAARALIDRIGGGFEPLV